MGNFFRDAIDVVIDIGQLEVLLAGAGLVLTDRLATKLGLEPGDLVRIEVLEGRRRTLLREGDPVAAGAVVSMCAS